MIARKFATHINVPGVPMNEQKITGEITMDQWNEVISELQQQGDVISQSSKAAVAKSGEEGGPAENAHTNKGEEAQKKTVEEKESVKEETPATTGKDPKKEKEEEDDEGETQLE
jgi:hypothetical protein